MRRPASLRLLIATVLGLGLSLGAPTLASASPARDVPAQVVASPAKPAPAAAHDSSSYAQREQRDHQVASYKGGSTIVIGASGAALIVMLLVLVLVI
jgi:hypothetical protein